MKRVAAILLLAGCAYAPEVRQARLDPAADVWAYYADGVDDAEVSVALVRDGVPFFAGDPRAIYRIGDLTELFVLEAASRLEERGVIDLGRPLVDYARFPLGLRYAGVTMRDLAELKTPRIDSDASLEFLVARFPWVSDARMALFSALLEGAVGKPVEEIVKDEVVVPLRLSDTTFMPTRDKASRVVSRGHSFDGIYSSVEDCVKFFASTGRALSSARFRHRTVRGVGMAYAVGRIRGGRRFVACPEGRRDFLLIFRNVTRWSHYKDFEFASETFAR